MNITYTDSYKLQHAMRPGLQGTTSGFPATVVRPYTPGMVEVRVPGGVSCISNEDFIPELTVEDAFAAVAPIFHDAGIPVHLKWSDSPQPAILFEMPDWVPTPANCAIHLDTLSTIMATLDCWVANFMPHHRVRYSSSTFTLYAYIEEIK